MQKQSIHYWPFGTFEQAAEFFGVDRTTTSRWRADQAMPAPAARLLLLHLGDLTPIAGSDWQGWRFHNGRLYGPTHKSGITPAQLALWPTIWAQALRQR